jgi:CheY-like chemotaxis protein
VSKSTPTINRRILVIDDNPGIHADFRKVLGTGLDDQGALAAAELALLGESLPSSMNRGFEVDSAFQGQEGVARVQQALDDGRPYAMAFVDMRMPPGWDGLETIQRLWAIDPDVQIVICSAHSDYDWDDVAARLNNSDKLLVIKKPFEAVEVVQSANALTRKWHNERIVRNQVETLEQVVTARTHRQQAIAPFGDARCPNGPAKPGFNGRSHRPMHRACRPSGPDLRRHCVGSRSLQIGERFLWTSSR